MGSGRTVSDAIPLIVAADAGGGGKAPRDS
jgi:hypothetical protein